MAIRPPIAYRESRMNMLKPRKYSAVPRRSTEPSPALQTAMYDWSRTIQIPSLRFVTPLLASKGAGRHWPLQRNMTQVNYTAAADRYPPSGVKARSYSLCSVGQQGTSLAPIRDAGAPQFLLFSPRRVHGPERTGQAFSPERAIAIRCFMSGRCRGLLRARL